MKIFGRWLAILLIIMFCALLFPGIVITGSFSAFVSAAIISLLCALLRPILIKLKIKVNFWSLMIAAVILNSILILIANAYIPGFKTTNFWWTLLLSLVISFFIPCITYKGPPEVTPKTTEYDRNEKFEP